MTKRYEPWDEEEWEPFEPPIPEQQLKKRLARIAKCRQRVAAELNGLGKFIQRHPDLTKQVMQLRDAGPQLIVDNTKVRRFRPRPGPCAA